MQLGYSEQKLRLVINRFNQPGAIGTSDFEHHLEYRTSFRVPNDSGVARALTRGVPLVSLQSSSPAARALDRLARTIVSNQGWEGEPSPSARELFGIATWRPFARSIRPAVQQPVLGGV
jgi:Flp pilus assembly CpaE family ATPase